MRISDIINEGYSQVWSRTKSGPVRRYRCSNGAKTGRVVAKPATCNTQIKTSMTTTFKKPKKVKHKKSKYNRVVKLLKKIRPR